MRKGKIARIIWEKITVKNWLKVMLLYDNIKLARKGRAKAADPTISVSSASHRRGGDAYDGDWRRGDWR